MKLSDSEWIVMRAVWELSRDGERPVSAREVFEAVADETDWAYNTVKTLLTRLLEKQALAERKRANASIYEPRVSRPEARRSALTSLVERAFDGTFGSLVQHMLAEQELTKKERRELDEMLERLRPPGPSAGRPSTGRSSGPRARKRTARGRDSEEGAH